ncbi:response regulator [Streptomyces sp. NPDC089919]|uniref:response regulator n=1 Tax=Streptomyces sp. NPDC089919 TaxID=3155188 RepID=UPI00341F07D1
MSPSPVEVLVVDDDFRVAEINATYVGKMPGFRVAGRAHTCAQALAFLEDHEVHLVLLDFYLPDENGLAFLNQMRQHGHHADVIMVTAARDAATVQAALRSGALQYLIKPFTFAGLKAKLDAYTSLRRSLQGIDEAGQEQVDRIFGELRTSRSATPARLPKGHSSPTADLIDTVLRESAEPLSAQEVATRAGLSRSTAQRYLKLLEESGRLRLTLKYGEAGRPEHRYSWGGPS